MNWLRSARVLILVATLISVASVLPGSAHATTVDSPSGTVSLLAQESEPVPTPSSIQDAQDRDEGTESGVLGRAELPNFLIALLVFGLLAFGILFLYLYMTQRRFYEGFSRLAESGKPPDAVSVSPFAGGAQPGTLSGESRTPPPTVKGPAAVTVGTQSDPFSVTQGDQRLAAARWSVSPATAAAVNPVQGPDVRVIATTSGAFELTATDPDSGLAATVQVAAIATPATGGRMPFVGSGFGSVAVTILLLVGVTALAFNGSLGSEAVATFFGGLLGYVFGVAAPASRASSDT